MKGNNNIEILNSEQYRNPKFKCSKPVLFWNATSFLAAKFKSSCLGFCALVICVCFVF